MMIFRTILSFHFLIIFTLSLDAQAPNPLRGHARRPKPSKLVFNYPIIRLEGGDFTMGSPDTATDRNDDECHHNITIAAFGIGMYEISQDQWTEVMGYNPSHFTGVTLPVEQVSWEEVQLFIKNLNEKTGKHYRLPTEAEWEFAAGGGSKNRTKYAGTNNPLELHKFANFYHPKTGTPIPIVNGEFVYPPTDGYQTTAPVKNYKPNSLGIYNMSGNVWEWCQDRYLPYDGCRSHDAALISRVVRGGSWVNSARMCRVANRGLNAPELKYDLIGFRLAED
ncbi:MAG: formylglycine-generating enzyme family protein [Phycisphaerae bacterium]|nr:formylglycine-generating enzyme family protein [Saprospiraceae bacterium]